MEKLNEEHENIWFDKNEEHTNITENYLTIIKDQKINIETLENKIEELNNY
jgi:hypothetical protein